jgi:hypothetical protein
MDHGGKNGIGRVARAAGVERYGAERAGLGTVVQILAASVLRRRLGALNVSQLDYSGELIDGQGGAWRYVGHTDQSAGNVEIGN